MKKGIFCISIDTELLWGRKDLDYSEFIERTKKERIIIKKLLKLFKIYNIPVTWAIVGKLYEKGDKLWSGTDFIKWIKAEKIHELASHSYSHEVFNQITKKRAEEEFSQYEMLSKKYKVKMTSFVFPRNKVGHLDILKRYRFTNYRGPDPIYVMFKKGRVKLLEMLDLALAIPHAGTVTKHQGLTNIPGSMHFLSARGFKKHIPDQVRFRKAKSGINKAVKEKKVFHLWFHPVDFADKSDSLFKEFEQILKYADEKRKKKLIDIKTMDQIANEFNLSKTD